MKNKQSINDILPTATTVRALAEKTDVNKTGCEKEQRLDAQKLYTQLIKKHDHQSFIPASIITWNTQNINHLPTPTIKLDNGALICDVSYFAKQYPTIAQQTIFSKQYAHWQQDILSTLVHAAHNKTVVIYIPPKTDIPEPLYLHTLISHTGSLLLQQIIIIVDKGASVTIYDQNKIGHAQTVAQNITGWIRENARATIICDQKCEANSIDLSTNHFYVDTNGSLYFYFLTTSSAINQKNVNVYAQGTGAHIAIRGAYILTGNNNTDFSSRQHHAAAHTTSDLVVKNIINDAAQSLYRGLIYIDKNATQTNANQENKNLLLGTQSRAYSIPEIEVLTNDVQCAHGSAIGQLDAQQLFYLQTRGLPKKIAERILIEGFLSEIFHGINRSLRDTLQSRILDELLLSFSKNNNEKIQKQQ